MSTKIRGITVEIGGDTTGLDKALKGVNSEIKSTQKELKDVNKLLKLDPKNTELLQQKQKLLGDAVEETKKKMEMLKKAQDTMKANGVDQNTDQYRALQREIIDTEKELRKAEQEAKEFGSVSLQKLQTGLQDVSDKAAKVQKNTKALSAAGAAVAGGLITNAIKAGQTADDLNTLAKQYGVTTAEIQKMNYAQDLIDVSTEDMLSSYSKMEKSMATAGKSADYANTAYGKLGVEIKNADGTMRKANDVWYDTLKALSKVGNETERDQLSMDIFGKSAMELAGVIDDGGAALKELGDEAERNGLILSQDALDGANKFNDSLDKLKATAKTAFLESGAALAENLIPALQKLVDIVSKVLTWFGNLDGGTQTLILTIAGVVAAISPIAGIISTISGAAAALNLAMLPTIGTIAAIVAGIGVFIAAGVAIIKNWDDIKAKAKELWQNIKDTFNRIKESIVNIWESIKAAIKLPHFSITGKFSLNPPSIPHISVDWYKKAMENGMILNSPTIFGMAGGRLLGAGEAGSETVVGTNSLMQMISGTIKDNLRYMNNDVPIVVQVTLDGKVIGETAANYSRMKARANG